MRVAVLVITGLVLSLNARASDDTDVVPSEDRGVRVYFRPGGTGPYQSTLAAYIPKVTDADDVEADITASSATEFLDQYRRLPRELQQYGIWLTLERDDLDSPSDREMVEFLKALCTKQDIFLFIQTGWFGGFKQFSGPSLEGEVFRPQSLPSLSVCTLWSSMQSALVGTWAMPLFVSTDYRSGVPRVTISDAVVEITFTGDHRYVEGIRGEAVVWTGRWCLDDDDLILQLDTQPKRQERIPWQRTERIARVSEKELVFTRTYLVLADATAEGVWTRVQ